MGNFFDIKKAYDTTWKYGIIKDTSHGAQRTFNPFHFNFLSERILESGWVHPSLIIGISLGSVLSDTLWLHGLRDGTLFNTHGNTEGSVYRSLSRQTTMLTTRPMKMLATVSHFFGDVCPARRKEGMGFYVAFNSLDHISRWDRTRNEIPFSSQIVQSGLLVAEGP